MERGRKEENLVEERIRKSYSNLTRSSKKIAEFLLSNMEDAAFFDISTYSRKINVSESTVMRFARALGYDGFPKMQEELRAWVKSQITPVKKMEKTSLGPSEDIYKKIMDADFRNLQELATGFKYERMEIRDKCF